MKSAYFTSLLMACLTALSFSDGNDAYRNEVYKRGLSVQSRMTVLALSLQPGFEDLAALSYLRLGRGAKVVNAFVTNGESGNNDQKAEAPGEVAFHKREEAFQVSAALQGTEYFLNFQDFGSARDTSFVTQFWENDSLQAKLVDLIESVRPDLILLAPDRQEAGPASARWDFVRLALLKAVHTAAQRKTAGGMIRPRSWAVGRVVSASANGSLSFPVTRTPEFDRRTFRSIGSEIGRLYKTMRTVVPAWQTRNLLYSVDYPSGTRSMSSPDEGIPGKLSAGTERLGKAIDGLWNSILTGIKKGTLARTKSATLKRLATVMDSIDVRLSGWNFFADRDRKVLLHWKDGLEELRNAIFGVSVHYTIKDTVLLARQLTTIRIDSVNGIPPGGTTDVFFPDVGRQWFLNEGVEQKVPLVIGSEYRLISPSPVELDLPAMYGGRSKNRHGSPFEFFVLHQKKSRAESFFKKISQRILFAPKLTVEPLTPIVRIVPGERFVYRMTNHSNDGIRDEIAVRDTLATADPRPFRLSRKESSVTDTLQFKWHEPIPDGSYRIPIQIEKSVVGYVVGRKFQVSLDSSRAIGVLSSGETSVLGESLRRLGVRYTPLDNSNLRTAAAGLQSIVIDERTMTLGPAVDSLFSFGEFMEQGGTVLVLSQDADTWNRAPIIEGIMLSPTTALDAQTEVSADSLARVMRGPNALTAADWEEWLFSRSENRVSVAGRSVSIPVRLGKGTETPGIIVLPKGKGKCVYVNLNLGKQLENIHPGVFRLLANLLAY